MVRIGSLFQDPAVEVEPGQLAVHEPLGTIRQVGDRRRFRRGGFDPPGRRFFRQDKGFGAIGHGVKSSGRATVAAIDEGFMT